VTSLIVAVPMSVSLRSLLTTDAAGKHRVDFPADEH
jgi:hypothetical protein